MNSQYVDSQRASEHPQFVGEQLARDHAAVNSVVGIVNVMYTYNLSRELWQMLLKQL